MHDTENVYSIALIGWRDSRKISK